MVTKVLYFQAHPVYGATENYLSTLAQGLNKNNFHSGIIYPDVSDLNPFSNLKRVDYIAIKPNYFTGDLIKNAYLIAKKIKKFAPDILHVNDPSPLGVFAARFADVKKIIISHHTPLLNVQYNWKGKIAKKLAYLLTDYFIFTSPYDLKAGSELENISELKSTVISYGLELEKFSLSQSEKKYLRESMREQLGIPQNHIVIASAGRLEPQKAQIDLVKAAKIICSHNQNITFVLAGEGSLKAELKDLIASLKLEDRFLLPGFMSNITNLLCATDIFTMSSLFEGLCYAVVEAGAMSIPVVATAVGGMCYSVADGETGILVEPGNYEELANKLNWVINNPENAKIMGEKGRERFLKLFTVERMVAETEALYSKLAN